MRSLRFTFPGWDGYLRILEPSFQEAEKPRILLDTLPSLIHEILETAEMVLFSVANDDPLGRVC